MPLNVISNFAANVAHRYLTSSDMEATSSLAKLSAGTRVLSAKDDAASLAIGARLNAEVQALKQATVNAGQAISMLQIADGAMGKVNDILIRMKTLAVQAGSGQLSATERSMLNTEFQALVSEVDRIATDTEFNSNALVNGSLSFTPAAGLTASAGVAGISGQGLSTGAAANSITFDSTVGTKRFTLTDTNGNSFTGSITATSLGAQFLNTVDVVQLTSSTSSGTMQIILNEGFDHTANVANAAIQVTGSTTTSLSFKVGSGTSTTADVISLSVDSVTAASLGVNAVNLISQNAADAASTAVSNAIDTLQTSRANIGASQNRLEFASANIATAIENQEAARSNLLDLDIAKEMSVFTSKQILSQAGISMLAQANQMPANLLRLFQ